MLDSIKGSLYCSWINRAAQVPCHSWDVTVIILCYIQLQRDNYTQFRERRKQVMLFISKKSWEEWGQNQLICTTRIEICLIVPWWGHAQWTSPKTCSDGRRCFARGRRWFIFLMFNRVKIMPSQRKSSARNCSCNTTEKRMRWLLL